MIRNVEERAVTMRGSDLGHYFLTPIGGGKEAALLKIRVCRTAPFGVISRHRHPIQRPYDRECVTQDSLVWYGHQVAKAKLDQKPGLPIEVETKGGPVTVGTITSVNRADAEVTIVLADGIEALYET